MYALTDETSTAPEAGRKFIPSPEAGRKFIPSPEAGRKFISSPEAGSRANFGPEASCATRRRLHCLSPVRRPSVHSL